MFMGHDGSPCGGGSSWEVKLCRFLNISVRSAVISLKSFRSCAKTPCYLPVLNARQWRPGSSSRASVPRHLTILAWLVPPQPFPEDARHRLVGDASVSLTLQGPCPCGQEIPEAPTSSTDLPIRLQPETCCLPVYAPHYCLIEKTSHFTSDWYLSSPFSQSAVCGGRLLPGFWLYRARR